MSMRISSMSSEAVANLSLAANAVATTVINVTNELVGDHLNHAVRTHINISYDLARKVTNVTHEGVINLIKTTDDVGICDILIGNITSRNVTTTVTSYNPAACGVYGSNPALKPLLIFILVCFTIWAIFGNGCLVGIIATDNNMQEPGNIFLCAMAMADVALSLTNTPNAIYALVHGQPPGGNWCRVQAFFFLFLAMLPMYLQTSLWICRYIHIARPLTYQSLLTPGRITIAMVLCFLIALTPPLIGLIRAGTVITYIGNIASVDIAEPSSLMLPCIHGNPESSVAILLCILGVVISCCFASLIYRLARNNQKKHDRKQAWLAQADKLENKLKAAKTLGIVVGVQWVTWIPGLILGLLAMFGQVTVAETAFYGEITHFIWLTSTFSDSIVYAFRNKIYRRALVKLYRKMKNAIDNF